MAILIGPYMWIHLSNNAVAQRVEDRLLEIPLPPDTELVDSAWAAQRLAGAGNGMEYYGSLLLRSDLDEAQLQEFYDGIADDDESQSVIATNSPDLGRRDLMFSSLHDLDQANLYMVMSAGNAPSALHRDLDLRGH
ncbi:hypothetical protein [Leucobacter sp. USHLN153]|uniref:hypothetical protein n=1 Tax=Leucobacter sp. USHLN153 TaxID=3081268 RepID=UPI00301B4DFE